MNKKMFENDFEKTKQQYLKLRGKRDEMVSATRGIVDEILRTEGTLKFLKNKMENDNDRPETDGGMIKNQTLSITDIISRVILDGGFNFGVIDMNAKKLIYVSEGADNLFGIDHDLPLPEKLRIWFDERVAPEEQEEQKRILNMDELPKCRVYDIIHPTHGRRLIGVNSSKTIEIDGKKIAISFSTDMHNE